MNQEMSQGSHRTRKLILGVAIASVACLWLVGARYGLPMALLVVAGGLLLGVIGMLWLSMLSLGGQTAMTVEEALSLAAPPTEEEQKRAVLRALKDLEYERRMGKIAEADYVELSQRYRGEAKALLLELDQSLKPAREAVEKLIQKRLHEQLELEADSRPRKSKHEPKGDSARASPVGAATAVRGPSRSCPKCSHRSPLSADTCEDCGGSLAKRGQTLCRSCPAVYDSSLTECPTCGVAGSTK